MLIRMSRIWIRLLVLLAVTCSSCSDDAPKEKVYRIAIETSWHVFNLGAKERNVRAFSKELIEAIGQVENISIETISVSYTSNFRVALENKEYDAIISTFSPEGLGAKEFSFSSTYLPLGALLVVRSDSDIFSLEMMSGKILGIPRNASISYDVNINPSVIIKYYDNINNAVEDLVNHAVDGIVLDVFRAHGFTQSLYKGRLLVRDSFLNDAGLRLATIKDSPEEELVNRFNRALVVLKENGTYSELIRKWKITYNIASNEER
jgi:ABC-type amino acid transport substrate-binding protein